jgi:hypothetical protein
MADLSPAAQAVIKAYEINWTEDPFEMDVPALAAAIRAATNAVVPHDGRYPMNEYMEGIRDGKQDVRKEFLAIADELEGLDA